MSWASQLARGDVRRLGQSWGDVAAELAAESDPGQVAQALTAAAARADALLPHAFAPGGLLQRCRNVLRDGAAGPSGTIAIDGGDQDGEGNGVVDVRERETNAAAAFLIGSLLGHDEFPWRILPEDIDVAAYAECTELLVSLALPERNHGEIAADDDVGIAACAMDALTAMLESALRFARTFLSADAAAAFHCTTRDAVAWDGIARRLACVLDAAALSRVVGDPHSFAMHARLGGPPLARAALCCLGPAGEFGALLGRPTADGATWDALLAPLRASASPDVAFEAGLALLRLTQTSRPPHGVQGPLNSHATSPYHGSTSDCAAAGDAPGASVAEIVEAGVGRLEAIGAGNLATIEVLSSAIALLPASPLRREWAQRLIRLIAGNAAAMGPADLRVVASLVDAAMAEISTEDSAGHGHGPHAGAREVEGKGNGKGLDWVLGEGYGEVLGEGEGGAVLRALVSQCLAARLDSHACAPHSKMQSLDAKVRSWLGVAHRWLVCTKAEDRDYQVRGPIEGKSSARLLASLAYSNLTHACFETLTQRGAPPPQTPQAPQTPQKDGGKGGSFSMAPFAALLDFSTLGAEFSPACPAHVDLLVQYARHGNIGGGDALFAACKELLFAYLPSGGGPDAAPFVRENGLSIVR